MTSSSAHEFPWVEAGILAALGVALIGLGAGTARRRHRMAANA